MEVASAQKRPTAFTILGIIFALRTIAPLFGAIIYGLYISAYVKEMDSPVLMNLYILVISFWPVALLSIIAAVEAYGFFKLKKWVLPLLMITLVCSFVYELFQLAANAPQYIVGSSLFIDASFIAFDVAVIWYTYTKRELLRK